MTIMQSSLSLMDKLVRKTPGKWWRLPVNDAGIPLSPGLHIMTKLRKLTGPTALDKMTVEKARKRIDFDLIPVQTGYPVAATRRINIRLKDRDLAAQHYTPTSENAKPIMMVYFHGGGWVTGGLETHDDVCRLLCESAGIQVLSVDYRRPPECKFPGPLNDAIESVKWAQANAHVFDIEPDAIAVGGDSAGGNFASVVAQDSSLAHPLIGQLLLYPCIDRETEWPSRAKYSKGLFLSIEESQWFYNHYLGGDGKELGSPLVAPIKGEVCDNTPPALVITAGFDILRDEGKAYAEWLREQDIETQYICFLNLVHAFANLAAVNDDCYQAVLETGTTFGSILGNQLERMGQAKPVNKDNTEKQSGETA